MPPPADAGGGRPGYRPPVMTTTSAHRPHPRLGPGRLIGIGIALGALFVLSRLPIGQAGTGPAADPAAPPATVIGAPPALDPAGTLGLRPPGERVAFWEARVSAGGSFLDLIHLADAYLDRSRATGDLDDLQRAATALDRAADTAPYPHQVAVRRAQVAFALHEFADAMRRSDAVLRDNPTDLAALGVAGDARLETGDVDGARERYLKLAELAPSPAAWSRIGRLAFLTGDPERAERLVALAASVSLEDGAPDAAAFYQFQLGDLRRAGGDLRGAEAAYTASLEALPDYVPAMAGKAAVLEARGERGDAIRLLERATARLPLPELVAALGDLYALDGNSTRAEAQYAIVEGIARLGAATARSTTGSSSSSPPITSATCPTPSRVRAQSLPCAATSTATTHWPGPCSVPGTSRRRRARLRPPWHWARPTRALRTTRA